MVRMRERLKTWRRKELVPASTWRRVFLDWQLREPGSSRKTSSSVCSAFFSAFAACPCSADFSCSCSPAADLQGHSSRSCLAFSVNLHQFLSKLIFWLILKAQLGTCYWGFLLASEWASERISACWCTCSPVSWKMNKIIMIVKSKLSRW